MDETTPEVNYQAIALGKEKPWFINMVTDLEEREAEYPHSSHGFSRKLANVHRAHPALSFSCAPHVLLLRRCAKEHAAFHRSASRGTNL